MKREDLKNLEIGDEAINKIMALHGSDIEKHKASVAQQDQELTLVKEQLEKANETIEGFKKMDIEGIKAAADEWKAKAEQATQDAEAKIAQIKFESRLSDELTKAKGKNVKAIRALLNENDLKLSESGEILGLKEQLEAIKSENDFLFDSDTPTPQVITGGAEKQPIADSVILAARKAAGLKTD